MEFNVRCDVRVEKDQEKNVYKDYDNWDDADIDWANDEVKMKFGSGIGVPYSVIDRTERWQKYSEKAGMFSVNIEVDLDELLESFDFEVTKFAFDGLDVTIDHSYHRGKCVVVKGNVRGKLGYMDEMASKISRVIPYDDTQISIQSSREYMDDENAWHLFTAEVPIGRVLEEDFSVEDYNNAVWTGQGGVEVSWNGW